MLSFDLILSLVLILSTFVSIALFLSPTSYQDSKKDNDGGKLRFQILVLGDIGRSPRMQYHAISVSKHGGLVDLIGYKDSELHPDVTTSPSITVHEISHPPHFLSAGGRFLFLISAPLKVLFQCWSLWNALGNRTEPAKWLIVQNPPSIPTLAIAQAVCFLRNTHLLVDWHNFGYSILALKLGNGHPLVGISRWYERTFSWFATTHFTVTRAMARILEKDYQINAPILTLHDRPVSGFHILQQNQRLAFLGRLPVTASAINDIATGKIKVLVSSTSWTPDEDFSILLDALVDYSGLATSTHPHLPELLVIITGKGPLKDHYLKQVAGLVEAGELEMVRIETAWLSTEDYASLLGSASLGISLHMSSSGVDLPMKVVDMFGAGLPVVGWSKFESWPELVTEGVNGKGFGTSVELREVLVNLLGSDGTKLQKLRRGAEEESKRKWDDEWDEVAGRLFGLC